MALLNAKQQDKQQKQFKSFIDTQVHVYFDKKQIE